MRLEGRPSELDERRKRGLEGGGSQLRRDGSDTSQWQDRRYRAMTANPSATQVSVGAQR
jgi:hypothetical protein